jgi:transposase
VAALIFVPGLAVARRWSDEAKGQVIAESHEPGAVVSEVARRLAPSSCLGGARRHGLTRLVLPAAEPPMFVPVVTAAGEPDAVNLVGKHYGSIVIEIAAAVVRAEPASTLAGSAMCCVP